MMSMAEPGGVGAGSMDVVRSDILCAKNEHEKDSIPRNQSSFLTLIPSRFPIFHTLVDFFEDPDTLIYLFLGVHGRNGEP